MVKTKKKAKKVLFALLLVIGTGAGNAQANLLTNGRFEDNTSFVERSDFPRVADLSGSAPTGWTRDAGTLAEYFTSSPAYLGVTIYNAADGNYFVGPHDGEWWEQTFATTPGAQYNLSYMSANGAGWWSTFSTYYRPGIEPGKVTLTGSTLLLSVDLSGSSPAPSGSTLLDSPFAWSANFATFTADSSFTTLRFAGSTVPNGGFVFVDNVAVTAAIPEPDSASLVAVGLAALLLVGMRRSRSVVCSGET
jgi:hypothetical protein